MKKWLSGGLAMVLAIVLTGTYAADSRTPSYAQWMQAVGFLNGDETGNLRLEAQVSRAEAVALVMRALGKGEAEEPAAYTDVPAEHWASGNIAAAVADGIVSGFPDGTFRPEQPVQLDELLKFLVTALGYAAEDELLAYPEDYIQIAEQLGLTENVDAAPGQMLTRLQTIQIFHNAFAMEILGTARTMRETYLASARERESENRVALDGYAPGAAGSSSMTLGFGMEATFADLAPESPAVGSGGGGGGVSADEPVMPMPAPLSDEQQIAPEPGQLTAGRWNDHENWVDWMLLMSDRTNHQLQSQWEIPTDRYAIRVLTEDGQPAWDAMVTLLDEAGQELWHSRTDRTGIAYLFAANFAAGQQGNQFSIAVETADGQRMEQPVQLSGDNTLELQIPTANVPDGLDLMFVVDTTGSMGDELQYIKEELKDVVQTIDTPVRLSCNFYRDTTDVYTIRPFPFETDLDTVLEQISQQRAEGGGDYEEAVDMALIDAIDEHEWSDTAKARLLFLVLDAPPHHTPEVVANLQAVTAAASQKGVRIIPVASSGVDKNTEFLMRSLAIATNGTYLFLTDDSGIGNSHIQPTIGEYQVEYLNDLIRSVIWEYIGQQQID